MSEHRRNASMVIVITGLDGVGKTTQATLLCAWLGENGFRATYRHHSGSSANPWRWIKRRLHRPAVASMKAVGVDIAEGGEEHRPHSGSMLGYVAALPGIVAGWQRSWIRALRFRRRILVCDRWFLDDVVKAEWRYGVHAKERIRLLTTIPRPDLVLVLRAPVALSHGRKKPPVRIGIDAYRRKARILDEYVAALELAGWPVETVDCGTGDVAAIQNRLRSLVAAALRFQYPDVRAKVNGDMQ